MFRVGWQAHLDGHVRSPPGAPFAAPLAPSWLAGWDARECQIQQQNNQTGATETHNLLYQSVLRQTDTDRSETLGATGATGPIPEYPKGLNGPTGASGGYPSDDVPIDWNGMKSPWMGVPEPSNRRAWLAIIQKMADTQKMQHEIEIALRAELSTLRARIAERDAAVAWAIKRGR